MNNPHKLVRASLIATMAVLSGIPAAFALEVTLPAETASYKASELPGYRLVQQNCMTCHSAQYVQTQPLSSTRAYWEATVKKMKKPFGAPLKDEDMPAMVDYLVKTYGAERGKDSQGTVGKHAAVQASTAPQDARSLLSANNCTACHAVDKKVVGPALHDVAAKYAEKPDAATLLMQSIRAGGSGKWGAVPMPGFPQLSEVELKTLATWVLTQ
ncbi:SorB family sulfite dehydrogenase c-type cytochrome subunit [Cupriavidus basilensis]|uniref:SorB family sulfite dehydrogenase c-type cytochrome subunit n=1 Tax=Cupriavidus basilensis TaxID=68895 RepID=UPI002844F7D1|nr:c-type cytochrome [Cupriavidus basilensis]MDR3381395.1 c-type cytochrome [Cupriavidus basilensis]